MLENIPKKEKAIRLRKEGKTYSEILKEIPVAKSTLSEWFRDVGLSKKQYQVLTERRLEARRRGGRAKHIQRMEKVAEIRRKALLDIDHISERELWLIGTALYWAEGAKEKEYYPGSGLKFSNSDPHMIKIFITWLIKYCKVSRGRIRFEIYIHENSKNSVEVAKKYWSQVSGFSVDNFNKVYFKKNKMKRVYRRNIGVLYYGQLRVKVMSSSTLVRQIAGWTEAIVNKI